jgi:hypothetical protein
MAEITDISLIQLYGLKVLRSQLQLEIKGLKSRGQTAYSRIKQRFGFKGGRASVLEQFENYIAEQEKIIKVHPFVEPRIPEGWENFVKTGGKDS